MISIKELNKIGEGQEAEIYQYNENKVLKLFKNDSYTSKVDVEYNLSKIFHSIGISIPKVYELVEIDNKPGYTMEYINGESLLSILLNNPRKANDIALTFASNQVEINHSHLPENLKNEKDSILWSINNSGLPREQIKYGIHLLKKLPNGNNLCHGDYNLANLIIKNNDNKSVVIDWGGAAKGYFVSDIANAVLMIKNGSLPSNINFFTKIFLNYLRSSFVRKYIKEYKKIKYFTNRELRDWEIIRAMARLAFCIDSEKPMLRNYINKSLRKTNKIYLF